jgi:hypothetical protein
LHLSPPTLLRKELDFSPPSKAGFFLPSRQSSPKFQQFVAFLQPGKADPGRLHRAAVRHRNFA